VFDYVQNARTIRPRARHPVLSLVEGYHEETNPETYHRSSWAVVRQPYLNDFQYHFALLQAEHARCFHPSSLRRVDAVLLTVHSRCFHPSSLRRVRSPGLIRYNQLNPTLIRDGRGSTRMEFAT
jgi:hypothetical protein